MAESTHSTLVKRANQQATILALLALVLAWSSPGFSQLPPNSLAEHDSKKWEPDIAAFEASDRTNPPPKNYILFVGSSSIRLWSNLSSDFPGLPVVNRGFGGSQLADSVNFAQRIILRYQPREVVIYAGANDLAEGKAPEVVFGDFVALVTKIHEALPHTRIAFIATAPNPKRWAIVDRMRKFNSDVKKYCQKNALIFIDVFPLMLGEDGLPKPDIFRDDRLHMNDKGYAIWKEAVGPFLK
jgi:lysophospholipase L1-like esterase